MILKELVTSSFKIQLEKLQLNIIINSQYFYFPRVSEVARIRPSRGCLYFIIFNKLETPL